MRTLIKTGVITIILGVILLAAPSLGIAENLGPAFTYGHILGPVLIIAGVYLIKISFKQLPKKPNKKS